MFFEVSFWKECPPFSCHFHPALLNPSADIATFDGSGSILSHISHVHADSGQIVLLAHRLPDWLMSLISLAYLSSTEGNWKTAILAPLPSDRLPVSEVSA